MAHSTAFARVANVQITLALLFLRLLSSILRRVLRANGARSVVRRDLLQLTLLLLLKDVDQLSLILFLDLTLFFFLFG